MERRERERGREREREREREGGGRISCSMKKCIYNYNIIPKYIF